MKFGRNSTTEKSACFSPWPYLQSMCQSSRVTDHLRYAVHRIGFFIFPVLEVPVIKDERSG
jgi:hypothetical protein